MIQTILSVIPDWLEALSLLVASASVIAAATNTPKDDSAIAKIYKIIDFLAINFGKAKQ
jgi:uncharacterized protein involved in cysteine biosynthesis